MNVGEKGEDNRFPIVWLPHLNCSQLAEYDMTEQKLDGVLFYHKE